MARFPGATPHDRYAPPGRAVDGPPDPATAATVPGLLAVDLGLRTGLARFGRDGRLAWYRSQHYGSRERLRRGVRGLLDADPALAWLILEGGGPLADIWAREAGRRGLGTRQLSAEDWRVDLFPPRDRRDRRRAKLAADGLARRVIAWSGLPRPVSLRHDAAEAILVGIWGARAVGWMEGMPEGLG